MEPQRRDEARAVAAAARRERDELAALGAAVLLERFRMPQRREDPASVIAHLGPTNSGKSHDAMAFLAEVGSGTYAAPLRLLAHEAFERLSNRLPAGQVGLRTGEEQINADAPIICCTTELAPMRGEVLILDEVHWVEDPERGWAWGRLLAAAEYRHHRLVGALNAEPVLQAAYGDQLQVQRHQRLVELRWAGAIEPTGVEAGSLVVAFSRKAVLALARDLATATGLRVGALYGALPPQARTVQVARFLGGELDVLCVTDVIGHGINLPARTVVMAETSKFDGQRRRPLLLWEAAQIVGRAGRFGLAEEGRAQVLRNVPGLEANASLVRQAVEAAGGQRSAGPGITTAPIRPTLDDLGATTPAELHDAVRAWQVAARDRLAGHGWLRAAPLHSVASRLEQLRLAKLFDQLSVAQLWRLATLSVDSDDLVVEAATHLAQGGRPLRGAGGGGVATMAAPGSDPTDPTDTLGRAERDAARARGAAAMARAFPSLASDSAQELLAAEQAAAHRIIEVLPAAISSNPFGRCESCGKPCATWLSRCPRCSGNGPRLPPPKRGQRGPKKRH
ncbi:MAG: helicase-related protein [Acidimicrobiales bacterium]